MSAPRVSIVVPTYNGAATLPALLEAVEKQRTDFGYELVAVDSGSGDGTLDLLAARAQHLIRIPKDTFNHGLTRNLGIEKARGEIVVLVVQDAVPASSDWLRLLTAPLLEDPRVAGTFARQLPRPEASRIARRMMARWVAAQDAPSHRRLHSTRDLEGMRPEERLRVCAFDNVCSAISRAVWKDHPFPAARFAEDLEWAKTVVGAGYETMFVPEATVFHSHDRSLSYELERTYIAHRRLYELFGLRTIPTARHLCRSWLVTLSDHLRCLVSEPGPVPGPREIVRTMGLALVWPLGQYLGGRAGANGTPSVSLLTGEEV
jgi:rhamnosyltransferase